MTKKIVRKYVYQNINFKAEQEPNPRFKINDMQMTQMMTEVDRSLDQSLYAVRFTTEIYQEYDNILKDFILFNPLNYSSHQRLSKTSTNIIRKC